MASELDRKIRLLVVLNILMLGIFVANGILQGVINYHFALIPGRLDTLPYIFTSPFLHGSWQHLTNNMLGMTLFSTLCLLRGIPFFIKSSLVIIVVTGLAVWLLGRESRHIGASGWVFGLWSLSIAVAWFQRSFLNIVISLGVVLVYGGMIVGVLPGRASVSFESHLFGALSGVLAAYLVTPRSKSKKLR